MKVNCIHLDAYEYCSHLNATKAVDRRCIVCLNPHANCDLREPYSPGPSVQERVEAIAAYQSRKTEIKEQLLSAGTQTHVGFEESTALRVELHELAKKHYKPAFPEEYLQFMNENQCSFDILSATDSNPCYFSLFTDSIPPVHGDCVEECLDRAIDESCPF